MRRIYIKPKFLERVKLFVRGIKPAGYQYGVAVFAVALLALFGSATVSGLTTISQSFLTPDKLPIGSIVSLEADSTDRVKASTNGNANAIVGIVINEGNSLLSLTSNHENQVQVVTSGVVKVLVSDINGGISAGDHITASPIAGVGMKATNNVKTVGIAQGDLQKNSGHTEKYTDSSGKQQTVRLGEVPIVVSVSYYFKQPERTIIPSAIQKIANALAGKTVSPLPIIISLIIFIVALAAVVSIIYSMIRSSIISVGRNPLSQAAVYRNLIQISALVIVILGVAIISIYLVLTRF